MSANRPLIASSATRVELFMFAAWLAAGTAGAEDVDPALGMNRSLNIEEAWVENAAYVFATADNSLSTGRMVTLEGEADFVLSDRFGGEVEFPQVLMRQPLGRGASLLGPVTAGLRFIPFRFGTPAGGSAGLCAVEVEGAFAPVTSPSFPDVGHSWTAEVLAGFRYGTVSVQGNYGFTRPLGRSGPGGWSANTSLAFHLSPAWVPQIEADLSGGFPADDQAEAFHAAIVPEIVFQTGEWTLEAGEELGASWAESVTILMIERDL